MTRIRTLLVPALATLVACSSSKKPAGPDAPLPVDGTQGLTCAVTAGDITTYPGMVAGTVNGGGADETVADGACTTQSSYFAPAGEDVVVHLGGLTVGGKYGVLLDTQEDLSFYVATDCPPPAGGAITHCVLFEDASFTAESGVFTATGTDAWVVVDTAADPAPPTTGAFTLHVAPAECSVDTQATDCPAQRPLCNSNFACVECLGSFDCTTATTPACVAGTCAAGPMQCTGDDSRDTTGNGDDGPSVATVIAMPTTTPTTISGAVCDLPAGSESDWFKIDLTGDVGIELTFTGAANDLDLLMFDSTGALANASENNAGIPEAIATSGITPGTYYLEVVQYEMTPANTVAVPYTLKVALQDCATSFDCPIGKPACSLAGVCGAGTNACVGDDSADTTGTGDDGPKVARALDAGGKSGKVCSAPTSEADWYSFTVVNGQGVKIALAWTDTTVELDTTVFDSNGVLYGVEYYRNPSDLTLTYLPAGTYYVSVVEYSPNGPTTVSSDYTISATKTAVQLCATATDCASEYQTQAYRGQCNAATTKTCTFLTTTAQAEGMPCDSGNNCTSGECSYIPFESDAQKSVCTKDCTTTADCASLTGFTCLSSTTVNTICIPSCAADLECGANQNVTTPDTGEAWHYNACDVSTGVCTF